MMKPFILSIAASFVFAWSGSLFAQGVQTGTIRGTVTDQQNLAVPGVTVTVTSPHCRGRAAPSRTARACSSSGRCRPAITRSRSS